MLCAGLKKCCELLFLAIGRECPAPRLERVHRCAEHAPFLELYTDACPSGIGGVLYKALKPVAFSARDAALIGAALHEPTFQSEFELYAVLMAILLLRDFFADRKARYLAQGKAQPSQRQHKHSSSFGAAINVAKRRKRVAYPELLRPGPQRLCVLACEVGGRWSEESLRLVTQLVRLRAQRAPAALRPAARQGWLRRWWGFLSVALQSTLAATLLGAPYVAGALPGAQHPRPSCAQPFGPVVRRLHGDLDLADIKRCGEKNKKKKSFRAKSPVLNKKIISPLNLNCTVGYAPDLGTSCYGGSQHCG